MEMDINTIDVNKIIFERLQEAFVDFREMPPEKTPISQVAVIKLYGPGEKAKAVFESLMVTTMYDVEIRNVEERETLDLTNSFITLVMPADSLPLPIYAADTDVHKGKYIHAITDLIPLSKDSEYRKKYDEPVKKLRKKYESLPGLMVKVAEEIHRVYPSIKPFEAFSSSGRVIGNIPVEYGPQLINLLKDYVDLYCSFVKESTESEILKREEVRKEALEIKNNFKKMMAQRDVSVHMPNLPRSAG